MSLLGLFFFPQQKELLNLLAVGDICFSPDFFVVNVWDVKFQDGPKKNVVIGMILRENFSNFPSGCHGLVDGSFFERNRRFHVGCMDPSG